MLSEGVRCLEALRCCISQSGIADQLPQDSEEEGTLALDETRSSLRPDRAYYLCSCIRWGALIHGSILATKKGPNDCGVHSAGARSAGINSPTLLRDTNAHGAPSSTTHPNE